MADVDDLRALARRAPTTGVLRAIVLRPARGAPARRVDAAEAIAGLGLAGDRRSAGRAGRVGGPRQVTLIQAEHLPLIARWAGLDGDVDPTAVRRNLVVEGLNLDAAKWPFPGPHGDPSPLVMAIGDRVRLVVEGPCDPCAQMEVALGAGGFQAMRGHGGRVARVQVGGALRVGDTVRLLAADG